MLDSSPHWTNWLLPSTQAESVTDFESYAEAMQATLTDLAPDQIEAILPGEGQHHGLGKVETADGILQGQEEDGEEVEDDDSNHGPPEADSLLYTGESM